MPTKRRKAPWGNQRGGFSPFMFGLVMGMGIFSALSLQWARNELTNYQKLQAERAQNNANDIAKGLDFAILTENQNSYSDNYDLERARQYSNSDARTRGGQQYMVESREEETRERYGQRASTVAITASDDTLLRSQIHRTDNAEQILLTKTGPNQGMAVYDTSTARDRQVRTSNERMENLAEQMYAFYAAQKRFPTDSEFTTLLGTFPVKDVWGNAFDYTPDKTGQKGTLSFTTPWNYSQSLNLNLKDGEDESE